MREKNRVGAAVAGGAEQQRHKGEKGVGGLRWAGVRGLGRARGSWALAWVGPEASVVWAEEVSRPGKG